MRPHTKPTQSSTPPTAQSYRRKKLPCIAKTLKAVSLAYRECVFDLDISTIELKVNVLHLQIDNIGPRSRTGPFKLPDGIPLEHKEAALADHQCSCVKSLLGPLARHLMSGLSLPSTIKIFKILNPVSSITRSHTSAYTQTNLTPFGHTDPRRLVTQQSRNGCIDPTGYQYSFRDILASLRSIHQDQPMREYRPTLSTFDFTETSDVDFVFRKLGLVMIAHPGMRRKWTEERGHTLKFAELVETEVEGGRLCGLVRSGEGFEGRLAGFAEDLKRYLER
ncbi:hypothetical protein MBLNU457_g0828t1 [Dothideomycetes sp. NU457]